MYPGSSRLSFPVAWVGLVSTMLGVTVASVEIRGLGKLCYSGILPVESGIPDTPRPRSKIYGAGLPSQP
jgi:hypothetical protein